MKQEYEGLFGEMIALARITDGNEHLITPDSTALLRRCLSRMASGTADAQVLAKEIVAQKQKMVPDCFRCANPCGKTFPYDLGELPEGEFRDLKVAILDGLCVKADVQEDLLYRALTVVSLWSMKKRIFCPFWICSDKGKEEP